MRPNDRRLSSAGDDGLGPQRPRHLKDRGDQVDPSRKISKITRWGRPQHIGTAPQQRHQPLLVQRHQPILKRGTTPTLHLAVTFGHQDRAYGYQATRPQCRSTPRPKPRTRCVPLVNVRHPAERRRCSTTRSYPAACAAKPSLPLDQKGLNVPPAPRPAHNARAGHWPGPHVGTAMPVDRSALLAGVARDDGVDLRPPRYPRVVRAA